MWDILHCEWGSSFIFLEKCLSFNNFKSEHNFFEFIILLENVNFWIVAIFYRKKLKRVCLEYQSHPFTLPFSKKFFTNYLRISLRLCINYHLLLLLIKEKYCEIKDSINNYNELSIFGNQCPSCLKSDHKIENCPLITYSPNKAKVIEHYIMNNNNNER